jgi:hypothetical protein
MKRFLSILIFLGIGYACTAQSIEYSTGDSEKGIAFNGSVYVGKTIFFGRTSDTSSTKFKRSRAGAAIFDTTLNCLWIYNGSYCSRVQMVVTRTTATAVNATATITDTVIRKGLITSTSAAATAITLPTATQLGTAFHAVKGTSIEFIVDNTAGANTVTITPGAGTTATAVITGGNTMTVSASATAGIGVFRITFISATAAVISRIL